MTPQAIQNLQMQLGLPQTGVFDAATSAAYNSAVSKSLSSNPDYAAYSAGQDPDAVLNAYQTGDWSGVVSLTGKPFTDEQQKAAVTQADAALAPAYKAQVAKDTADVSDTLRNTQENFQDFESTQRTNFGADKDSLDKSAADNGVLFAGSRVQKENNLRNSYQNAETVQRRNTAESLGSTARNFQYAYGNDAAKGLSSLYSLPGQSSYNANRAGGPVTPGRGISSVYDTGAYDFQGTAPVAQKTAVQTRAASLLANRANKLTLSGVGAKF